MVFGSGFGTLPVTTVEVLLIGSRVTVGIVTSDTGVVTGVPLPASSFGVTFTSVPGFSGSLSGVGTENVPSEFTGTVTGL